MFQYIPNAEVIISIIYLFFILNIIQNNFSSKAQENRLMLRYVLCCGLSNGNIALLPLPSSKSMNVEASYSWDACVLTSDKLGYNMSISCVNIAWNYLYVGYVCGTIRVYSIGISESDADKKKLYTSDAIQVVTLTFLSSQLVSNCFHLASIIIN